MICKVVLIILLFETVFGKLLNSRQNAEITKYHNAKRKEVGIKTMLRHDQKLATLASQWADRCVFEHPDYNNEQYKDMGQNIAACGRCTEKEALKKAYEGWYNEIEDYHASVHQCNYGKVCGHYTQMVWAKTKKMGCGIAACDNIFNMQGFFVVCQYTPPGNWYGENPYRKK